MDGTLALSLKGQDNDTRRVESLRLGAVGGIDAGTRGTTYLASFAWWDTCSKEHCMDTTPADQGEYLFDGDGGSKEHCFRVRVKENSMERFTVGAHFERTVTPSAAAAQCSTAPG